MTEATVEELRNRALPKWPQMYVTGKQVTAEQAKEIIRRTDTFFTKGYGGNDRKYDDWVRKLLGFEHRPCPEDATDEQRTEHWRKESARRAAREASWGAIRTNYVHNSWVSHAYVYGPNGWCHPDGTIGYVDNVGKWPDVEDIERDWQAIAQAFPFLQIGVTLYSGKSCEENTEPIVSMLVQDGTVTLCEFGPRVHVGHPPAERGNGLPSDIQAMIPVLLSGNHSVEHGLPDQWFYDWAAKHV